MSSDECSSIDEFIHNGGTALITGTSGVHNTYDWTYGLGLNTALGVSWPAEQREIFEGYCWNMNMRLSGDPTYDAVFKGVFEKQRISQEDTTENDILLKNGWNSPAVVPIFLTTAKLLAYWTDYYLAPPDQDPRGEDELACALTCNKYGNGYAIFFNGKLFSGYKYCREIARWAHRDTDPCQNAEKIVFNVIRNFTDIPKSNLELASWWIQRQQHEKSGLVDSYEDGDRDLGYDIALLYDQALSVMAYNALADYDPFNSTIYKDKAYKILDCLQYLQQLDGSFYFSYNHKSGTITPANLARYTNANAWLLMAINRYEAQFNDPFTFREMATDLANWLCNQLDSCDTDCQMIRGGINAKDQALIWYNVEHNLAAYAALDYFGYLTHDSDYTTAAQNIRQFLETYTWDDTTGCFLRGLNDPVAMMNVNPWGVLALGTESQKGYNLTRGLNWALENCRTSHAWEGQWDSHNYLIDDIDGFDFNDDCDVVWVEGTESMALALRIAGQYSLANHFHTEITKMILAANNGGLPYATNAGTMAADDETRPLTYPSVAGTAWYIFKELNYNPFENPFRSPQIEFTFVPAYGSSDNLIGRVRNVDPASFKVAVYIYVGKKWWTKPSYAEPLTPIQSDSTWTTDITTGGNDPYATKIHAFLLPNGVAPPIAEGLSDLPSSLDTLAIADIETVRNPRSIHFSGYDWLVKASATEIGPGPNYFSDSNENVWVDNQDQLHLKITNKNEKWYCAEVILNDSFGYGNYSFMISGKIGQINENAVLGLFTWDDNAPDVYYREIDIEFSRWGEVTAPNAQYVVQPYEQPGNIDDWTFPPSQELSIHSFYWQSDSISFLSVKGHQTSAPADSIIHSWKYTGSYIPTSGNENVRINLWLFHGIPPSDSSEVEVIITKFEYNKTKPQTQVAQTVNQYVSHYSLSQNYPNPFNSKTTITFGLPKPSEVEICIFNLSGQLVAEIFRGRKQAGYHSVSWNAGDNSSGNYFIKMVADNFIQIKKCVLLK